MNATELIIEWLADAAETAAEAATQAAVGDWLAHADDPAGDEGERITLQELNDLRERLDGRIRDDGDLTRLREHVQFGRKALGDIAARLHAAGMKIEAAELYKTV